MDRHRHDFLRRSNLLVTIVLSVHMFAIAERIQAQQQLEIASIFADNMVLPMERPIVVNGSSSPRATVTVRFADQQVSTRSNKDGLWRVTLKSLPMSFEDRELAVECGEERRILRNILVGRLFLCAGQSNMDFPLEKAIGGRAEIAAAQSFSAIRLLNATAPPTDKRAYEAALLARLQPKWFYQGTWTRADSAASFSAIGWMTARELFESRNEPIGIVDVSVGGSGAEAWLPADSLKLRDEYRSMIGEDWLEHPKIGAWVKGRARQNLGKHLEGRHPFRPATLFEFGVRPWTGIPFDGVFWYQGESNAEIDDDVWNEAMLINLVTDWRRVLDQNELPFFIIQLPEIGGNDPLRARWPQFRETQARACAHLKDAHLIVTRDLGWPDSPDVHPPDKRPIAQRLNDKILEQLENKGKRVDK